MAAVRCGERGSSYISEDREFGGFAGEGPAWMRFATAQRNGEIEKRGWAYTAVA